MKKRILLLTTGGTIASGDSGSGLSPVLSSEDFLQYVKEFEDAVSYTHLTLPTIA